MFVYGPGEHQFGELDYAWVEKNELRIRTRGGMVFGELYATENIAAGELLRLTRAAQEGIAVHTMEIDYTPPIEPVLE